MRRLPKYSSTVVTSRYSMTTQPIRSDFVAVRVEVRWQQQHRIMTESCFYAP